MTKDSAGRRSPHRQRMGESPPRTYSLDLGDLVRHSKIAEEKFTGVRVVQTEDEQRAESPAIVQAVRMARRTGTRRAH